MKVLIQLLLIESFLSSYETITCYVCDNCSKGPFPTKTGCNKCMIGATSAYLNRFIIEPFIPHDSDEEHYVCIYTERNFNVILFHHQGGIDIGNVDEKAARYTISVDRMLVNGKQKEAAEICTPQDLLDSSLLEQVKNDTLRGILANFIADLHRIFVELHFTYLELNPIVVCSYRAGQNVDPIDDTPAELYIHLLDAAGKVDQSAEHLFLANQRWQVQGQPLVFPMPFGRKQTKEEAFITQLDSQSGASMKLTVLNPDGRIWTLCAGGGASVIYADTICELAQRVKLTQGRGRGALELANYGEYSGAPSENQTYDYASTILSLMTNGEAHPDGKILIIGGGIANFTNVADTFKGIVHALTNCASALRLHKVQIFVRRAGPNYQEGLKLMRELGSKIDLPIHVFGPEAHMTAIVSMALGLRTIPESLESFSVAQSQLMTNGTNKSSSSHVTEPSHPSNSDHTSHPTSCPSEVAIFTSDTQCLVWGMQLKAVQSMLDFDYASHRSNPSVVGIIYPFGGPGRVKIYWGAKEIFLPVYPQMSTAFAEHPEASVLVNFASLRAAFQVTMEAMEFDRRLGSTTNAAQLKCIAIIAEGVPEHFSRLLIQRASERKVLLIGPATVGGIKAGCFKIGNTGGMIDNITSSRLHRPGSVAYVSRSGGMSNELNNIIHLNTDGVNEGIAIGGDRFPGSTFLDHILRFEKNPDVGMMVLLGEVGGREEYLVAEAVESGRVRKPIVAWCIGTCSKLLSHATGGGSVQFGHAGACANSEDETATSKNAALAAAGLHVPASFDDLDKTIRSVYESLVNSGAIVPKPNLAPARVPIDFHWAKELGLIRRPAAFTSTICDDRGSELLFAGVPITRVIQEDLGIGGVLGLLWFKRRLPQYTTKYLEICLMITADHGPAVAGALNTIVTARAGKDLLSSLASGLLTIGDRFGGALDGAARQFATAFDAKLEPAAFVERERREGRLIMGIGHRVKSTSNPDMRVQLLASYVRKHFPQSPLTEWAFKVEKITTSKRPNLILNVDGMIAVSMVDLLRHSGCFTSEEAEEYIQIGTLNGLFVLGRTIGFVGHYLDQKRLHQGLYRHPWEDISYLLPDPDPNDK